MRRKSNCFCPHDPTDSCYTVGLLVPGPGPLFPQVYPAASCQGLGCDDSQLLPFALPPGASPLEGYSSHSSLVSLTGQRPTSTRNLV